MTAADAEILEQHGITNPDLVCPNCGTEFSVALFIEGDLSKSSVQGQGPCPGYIKNDDGEDVKCEQIVEVDWASLHGQ